jgi:hypothetical protein
MLSASGLYALFGPAVAKVNAMPLHMHDIPNVFTRCGLQVSRWSTLVRQGGSGSERLWMEDTPHFVVVFATPVADDDDDDDDADGSGSEGDEATMDNRRRRRAAFHGHLGGLECLLPPL